MGAPFTFAIWKGKEYGAQVYDLYIYQVDKLDKLVSQGLEI